MGGQGQLIEVGADTIALIFDLFSVDCLGVIVDVGVVFMEKIVQQEGLVFLDLAGDEILALGGRTAASKDSEGAVVVCIGGGGGEDEGEEQEEGEVEGEDAFTQCFYWFSFFSGILRGSGNEKWDAAGGSIPFLCSLSAPDRICRGRSRSGRGCRRHPG